MVIIQDQQEKRPLVFKRFETRVEHMLIGDYTAEYSDGSRPPIVFERKSLGDLFGTMTSGYPRFRNEVLGSQQAGLKLVLLVEHPLTEVYEGYPRSSMTGTTCVKKLFTLWLRYGLQPVFCQDRLEAAAVIEETLEAAGRCWKLHGQPRHELFGGLQIPLSQAIGQGD